MLQLTVNGATRQLPETCSLSDALHDLGYEGSGFAVALDGGFIPRHRYQSVEIKGGEDMEVLAPMQGG